eukprot:7317627-Heterocapsa_arctica.AAC.1
MLGIPAASRMYYAMHVFVSVAILAQRFARSAGPGARFRLRARVVGQQGVLSRTCAQLCPHGQPQPQ